MKPAIKKLKTCTYSKDIAPLAATFGRREQHTNKLVCDHPEMKVDWNEKVCGPCTVYENRNAQLVVPVIPQPQPEVQAAAKGASPAESKQSSPAVTATAASPAAPVPTQPKPASKPAVTKPAALPPPTLSAAKALEKKTKVPAETKPKGSAKPTLKASGEQPQKPAKKTVAKPKK